MNLSLRPATLAALDAFRARRASLLKTRALLCAIAIALAAFAVIALLDRAWLMPDAIRPWFTLATYAGAIFAAWKVALRFISQAKGQEGAAKLIESAEPALRERLLAAVELSANSEVKDSAEFREKLQDDVAKAVEGVDWDSRLPSRSLKPWFLAAFGTAAVVAGLCFIPQLHLPGFLARAAVPFANFERPASLKITIVEPAPASTLAPIGSEVPLIIETEGAKAATATLEILAEGSRPRKIELTAFGTTRFDGLVPVGQNDIQYRVHAEDAITPWHTLSARARPRIVSFEKTIVPPKYTGLPETKLTEDQGDLEALEGSTVKLKLTANQPLKSTEILLNPELAEKKTIPSSNAENTVNTVNTVLEVTPASATWLAALTSAETGFTNEETTPWRITAIPDLPPTAQITEPAQQIELLPDEAVRLTGLATDDVGLASVQLSHAINGTKWTPTDLLITKSAKEAPLTHLLPLAPLGVKAGDAVLLKLIATDLKGQKAESQTVRVLILEQTIDPRQRDWAENQRRLAQRAESLAKQTRELTQSLEKVRQAEKKDPANADTALAKAQSAHEQVKEQSEQLWTDLKEAAKNAPNQLDAAEAQLLGEKLAQLRREALPKMDALEKGDTQQLEAIKKASRVADAAADAVASAARAFAHEDTAKIAAQESQQLQRQAKMLTENALPANRDANQRPQWQEQQRAMIAQTEALKKDLITLDETSRQRHAGQLKNLDKQLTETATDLNASLDKPDQTKSPEHLYGASDNLRNRLQQTADATRTIAEAATKEAEQRREQLMRQDNPALVALNEARQSLAEAEAAAKKPDKKPDKKPKQEKDGLTPAERAQKQLAQASKQLQDQAELREQNQLTNTQAALDTNRASRAIDELAQNAKKAATPEEIAKAKEQTEKLAQIARTLEADAAIQEAALALASAQQAAMQPANKQDLPQTAALAKSAAETLAEAQNQLNRTTIAVELTKQNPQAANQLRQLSEEAKNTAKNAAEQNKNLASQAAQAQPNQQLNQDPAQQATAQAQMKANELAALIEPQTTAARADLAILTPEVSDMMKKVAADLKKTQEQTQNAANEAKAEKPVAAVAEKAQALKAENAENTEKMAALQAALRQEANAADLTQKPEMQMARAADVALAQMQKNTPQIAQNLKQAAQATQSQPQAQNLQQAADAQQQAAQALQQLAQNMQKLEDGQQLTKSDQAAMAAMEQELGVQEPLDESYQRAQELAQMAQNAKDNPQAVLAALEKELPKNPAMQKALATLAKDTAQQSEAAVAKESQQLSNTGMATLEAANNLKRVARHQDRLGDKPAAQTTAEAAKQVEAAGKQAQATQATPQANPQMAQRAQSNAAQAAKSAETTNSKTAPPLFTSPLAQMQGQMLAAALDQIDAQLNPAAQSGQQSQSGQQQQGQGQQQQAAQNSLNQAQQAQQQQMADSRNSGQTPGQQPSPQQMAQNQKESQQNGAQSNEGGNKSQLVKAEGELGTITVLVPGDWGHLPQKMADDLTEATRTEAAPEYRAAIESYYKAIAQKAKK